MSSRRKNTKPQAIRHIPEHKPLISSEVVSSVDKSRPSSPQQMQQFGESQHESKPSFMPEGNHHRTSSPILSPGVDSIDGGNHRNGDSEMDIAIFPGIERPLMVVTDDSDTSPFGTAINANGNDRDSEKLMHLSSPVSPNKSINSEDGFEEDDDLDASKRKCREETKIHPYERLGQTELFRCPLCSTEGIESRKSLTCHLRLHQNKERREDGKHLCCLCSHELSSNSSLERHLLTHTNFRPFSCRYCTKAFTTNGNLSRHVKTTHDSTLLDSMAKSPRKSKTPKKTSSSSVPSDDIFDIIKSTEPLDIKLPSSTAPQPPITTLTAVTLDTTKTPRKTGKSTPKKTPTSDYISSNKVADVINSLIPSSSSTVSVAMSSVGMLPNPVQPAMSYFSQAANGFCPPPPPMTPADSLTAQLAAMYYTGRSGPTPPPPGFSHYLGSHHHHQSLFNALHSFAVPPGVVPRMPITSSGMFGMSPPTGVIPSVTTAGMQIMSTSQALQMPTYHTTKSQKVVNRASRKSRDANSKLSNKNKYSNNNNNNNVKNPSKAKLSMQSLEARKRSSFSPSSLHATLPPAKQSCQRDRSSSSNGDAAGLDLSVRSSPTDALVPQDLSQRPPHVRVAVKQEEEEDPVMAKKLSFPTSAVVIDQSIPSPTVPLAMTTNHEEGGKGGVDQEVNKSPVSAHGWHLYQRLQRRVQRKRQYACSQCYTSFSKTGGQVHRSLNHKSTAGRNSCSLCGHLSSSVHSILVHLRDHFSPLNRQSHLSSQRRLVYRCWAGRNTCSARFPSWTDTVNHVRRDHHNHIKPSPPTPSEFTTNNNNPNFFTPERAPTDTADIPADLPVLNSTPLDFSSRINSSSQQHAIAAEAVVDDYSAENNGALDLSIRNSTQSLHLTGLSENGNTSPDEADFPLELSAGSFIASSLPRIPVSHTVMCQSGYTPFMSLANSALQRLEYPSTGLNPSGLYAMRKPQKKSNLSKPQLNPDLVKSGFNFSGGNNNNNNNNYDNGKCCDQDSAAMWSSMSKFEMSGGYAGLPFFPLPSSTTENNREENGEDESILRKLARKKNSYKDAPKLITCPVPGCMQKFPWHSSLKRHIITHTEHKPYKCTRCHKSFSTKSNRERHMERLHGVSVKKHKRHRLSNSDLSTLHTSTFGGYNGDDSFSDEGASSMSNVSEASYRATHVVTKESSLGDTELKEEEILSMDTNDRQAESISTSLLMQAGTPQVEPNPERFSAVSSIALASSVSTAYRSRKETVLSSELSLAAPYRPWTNEQLTTSLPALSCATTPPPPSMAVSCATCGLTQDSVKSLRRHEKSHQTEAPYKCPLCAQAHSSRVAALDHLRESHASEWSMLVAKIGISRVDDLLVKFHTPPFHQQQQLSEAAAAAQEDLAGGGMGLARHVQCCICLHRFWSFQDLQRHMRSHTGERPFTCPVCGKEFSLKHSMQRHMRVHTEDQI